MIVGFIIDTKRREIKVEGTNDVLKLGTTVSGYFKMPMCHMTKQEHHVTLNIERLFGTTTGVKRQEVLRLHRQICHASSERLKRLLKNAGCS